MREIKFRLIFGGKVVGYEAHRTNSKHVSIMYSPDGENWRNPRFIKDSYIDHESKDQFTGLHDKNGKEIYEGDVVRAHYFWFDGNHDADGECIGVVEMVNFQWGISYKNRYGENYHMPFMHTSHFEEPCIEVRGNIYEHPHLLEEGNGN